MKLNEFDLSDSIMDHTATIKLSEGTTLKAGYIKEVYVDKDKGCRAKWWTNVRLYDGDIYHCPHDTREGAMNELDQIYEDAKAQGIYIGVRDWI